MKGKVGLITVLVDEIEPMKLFYRDVLGFKVSEDLGNYVEFQSESVRFSLCTREVMYEATAHDTYREPRAGQTFELAFPVGTPDDVDRVYKEVTGKGAIPVKEPEMMPWGRKTAFISDPEGNIHEIYSYKPEDPQ